MFRDLPEFPNLDHLRKQAKALLRALKQSNPEAKLTEAQHAVARSYGFASWAKLKAHIDSIPHPTATPEEDPAAEHGAFGGGTVAGGPGAPVAPGGGFGQFARYTEPARRTIFFARAWARRRNSQSIDSEHLLLGLIDADAKLMDRLLGQEHAAREAEFAIRRELDRRMTIPESAADIQRPLSNECRRVLRHAANEADRMRHDHIGTGHFLLGFMDEQAATATSMLINILADKGISPERAQSDIIQILNGESH